MSFRVVSFVFFTLVKFSLLAFSTFYSTSNWHFFSVHKVIYIAIFAVYISTLSMFFKFVYALTRGGKNHLETLFFAQIYAKIGVFHQSN